VLFRSLAEAYQRTSQHPEALKLFRLLSGRFPELAQDKVFRKAVQASERAVGAGASQLPSRKFNFKPLRNWAIAAAVVLALLFGSNFYIAQHRTLYVVSGLNQRVDVEIKGAGSLSLNKPGMWTMTVPEGRHQATLSGGLTQTAEFTLESDFFGRWFDKPAFILNAGGTAVLMVSHTVYSATPDPNAEMPFELYFGEPFLSLHNVDYHFVEFPDSLRLDRRTGEVSKSRVDLFRHSIEDLFFSLVRNGKLDRALPLAEWHLRLHPEATAILPAYVALAKAGQRDRQADALLAEAVKRRPIEIPWHRAYQERHMSAREMPALIREYEALLAAEPANSALLYLRGRLCSKTGDCMALFERAIAADPKNAHAHFALAYDQSSAGDWAAARAHLATAVELRPEEQQFQEAWYEVRLALQEGPVLEAELRQQLEKKPLSIDLNFKLCEVLLSQGRDETARKLGGDYEREALRRFPREGASYTRAFRQELLYALGDFAGLEKLLAGVKGEESQFDKFKALLESGKLPEAEALYPLNSKDLTDPFHFLAFSIAWSQAGDSVKGVLCRDKCVWLLRQGTLREQALASLLERARPVTRADVSEITLDSAHKAIVLTALGQRFPEQRAEMFAAARRLNVRRVYPYHLLNRVTGAGNTPMQLLSK